MQEERELEQMENFLKGTFNHLHRRQRRAILYHALMDMIVAMGIQISIISGLFFALFVTGKLSVPENFWLPRLLLMTSAATVILYCVIQIRLKTPGISNLIRKIDEQYHLCDLLANAHDLIVRGKKFPFAIAVIYKAEKWLRNFSVYSWQPIRPDKRCCIIPILFMAFLPWWIPSWQSFLFKKPVPSQTQITADQNLQAQLAANQSSSAPNLLNNEPQASKQQPNRKNEHEPEKSDVHGEITQQPEKNTQQQPEKSDVHGQTTQQQPEKLGVQKQQNDLSKPAMNHPSLNVPENSGNVPKIKTPQTVSTTDIGRSEQSPSDIAKAEKKTLPTSQGQSQSPKEKKSKQQPTKQNVSVASHPSSKTSSNEKNTRPGSDRKGKDTLPNTTTEQLQQHGEDAKQQLLKQQTLFDAAESWMTQSSLNVWVPDPSGKKQDEAIDPFVYQNFVHHAEKFIHTTVLPVLHKKAVQRYFTLIHR